MPLVRAALTLALLAVGCTNLKDRSWTAGGDTASGDADTDADADADTDTGDDTDTDTDTDTDPAVVEQAQFEDAGDVVDFADENSVVEVDLTDESGDESNQDQEFYMVVINTTEDAVGYRLRYVQSVEEEADTAANGPVPPPAALRGDVRNRRPVGPVASPPPPPTIDAGDIGQEDREFLVRAHMTDTDLYATVNARLWALGDNVAIWVDEDVAIDWDVGCDGTVDVPDPYNAFGFDNCDLDTIADIIDNNIVPNVRLLYGQESDIDVDGRISVVITPVLNRITTTSEDEAVFSEVLASYAEPSVDLTGFDFRTNAGSDEAEVIYVFAPDPYGYFNPDSPTTVEDYTSYQLAAEVARSFTTLISYNQKVLEHDDNGSIDDDWLIGGLGTFAADYCGFGAAYHADARDYLDAPHLAPLLSESSGGSLETLSYGAQFLFVEWLYDLAEASGGITTGPGLMTAIMTATDESDLPLTGTESVEDAVQNLGPDFNFSNLVVKWQVALLTSGVTDVNGDPLVDETEWIPYVDATTLSAPPASPGAFYGANGYQRGMNIRGLNSAWTAGTTDTPSELTSRRTRLENSDAALYSPGFEFLGFVEGNYAAQVVRLTGITYEEAVVQLQTSDTGLVGAVVRWPDPAQIDYAVENIYSVTSADSVTLPPLPADGRIIQGLGQISEAGSTDSVNADSEAESAEVYDTDRWLLDLGDRTFGEVIPVHIWLDRHFSDTDGTASPDDPWIAIAPAGFVPQPTESGTLRTACPDGAPFGFPGSLLEYLTAQVLLSDTMMDDSELDLDACGVASGTATTCDEDWDRDGVLDEAEPLPSSFYGQVLVMECTANGNVRPDPSAFGTGWLDVDEMDEDDAATYSALYNTGGQSGPEGEEGFVAVELEGGSQYLIVVGASGGGTGTYELSVRQTE